MTDEFSPRAKSFASGQLPTWWRRRDVIAAYVGKLGGRPMSARTYARLKFALDAGCPELRAAVDAGALSIAAAFEISHLPAEMQRKAIADRALRRDVVRVLRRGTR